MRRGSVSLTVKGEHLSLDESQLSNTSLFFVSELGNCEAPRIEVFVVAKKRKKEK